MDELNIFCYEFFEIDITSQLTVSVITPLAVNTPIFQIYPELT